MTSQKLRDPLDQREKVERSDTKTFRTSPNLLKFILLIFSTLMFTTPIASYFGAKQILEDQFDLEAPYPQLGAAIVAVLVVNLIILAYIIKAFKEETKKSVKEEKKD